MMFLPCINKVYVMLCYVMLTGKIREEGANELTWFALVLPLLLLLAA